ncbi:MAG: YdbH domain-containing protein [Psychromonas sp.]
MGTINTASFFIKKISSLFVFISIFLLATVNVAVVANELQTPPQSEGEFFSWLPLISSNLKRFQIDKHCPKNQLYDIQVDKKNNKLTINIGRLDWDLNCVSPSSANNSLSSDSTEQTATIDKKLSQMIVTLEKLPETEIHINSIYLQSDKFNKPVPLKLKIHKKQQVIILDLVNESGKLKANINLLTKNIDATLKLSLDKVVDFMNSPTFYEKQINGNLQLDYLGSLHSWEKGDYKLNITSNIPNLVEKVSLNSSGKIDLLDKKLDLKTLSLALQGINYQLSDNKVLKTDFINIKLSEKSLIELIPQLKITKMPINLNIGSSVLHTKQQVTKQANAKQQKIKINKQKLPALSMAIKAHVHNQKLQANWILSSLLQAIEGDFQYFDEKIQVKTQHTQLLTSSLLGALSDLIPALKPWSINSEKIAFNAHANFDFKRQSGRFKSAISANNINGEKEDFIFNGLSFSSKLNYKLQKNQLVVEQDKQQLSIDNLFIGIPIDRLQLDTKLNAGQPIIENFQADLLGGQVSLTELRLQAPSQSVLQLSSLSLSEIIKYSAYPDIQSQAKIDGQLPLKLSSNGISIENGIVHARPPGGFIKVPKNQVSAVMTESNPAFSFTLALLANFQFDRLQGIIDYKPEGDLDLKIEVNGLSPDVSGEQAINFNYTHQENILKLLESLRFIRSPNNVIY